MTIHVYTAGLQPATHFTDSTFDPPVSDGYRARELIHARCCGKRRRAENLVVQCYYDGRNFWCADGKGCKDPKRLEAQRKRRFRNRSRGQKQRWANAKPSSTKASAHG